MFRRFLEAIAIGVLWIAAAAPAIADGFPDEFEPTRPSEPDYYLGVRTGVLSAASGRSDYGEVGLQYGAIHSPLWAFEVALDARLPVQSTAVDSYYAILFTVCIYPTMSRARVRPYVLAGVGYAEVPFLGSPIESGSDESGEFHAGGGLDLLVHRNADGEETVFAIDARHVWASEQSGLGTDGVLLTAGFKFRR